MSERRDIAHVTRATPRRDLSYPPLPEALVVPVYDNHTHLEIARRRRPARLPRAARPRLERRRARRRAGRHRPGASRWSAEMAAQRAAHARGRRASTRTRRPRYEAAGDARTPRLAEIDELAAPPARARHRRDRARLLPHRTRTGRAAQLRSFEAHIAIAKQHGLALQIHDRDAHAAVIATLLRVGAPERTVFHCFSRRRRDGQARAPTTAGTSRSPAPSRSRTPQTCARRSR